LAAFRTLKVTSNYLVRGATTDNMDPKRYPRNDAQYRGQVL
jgi:hypothetical protein